jgi:hypothetical protein
MAGLDKASARQLIERNIATSGYHVYIVGGGALPRFAYTIGVSGTLGAELVLAGSLFFSNKDAKEIIDTARNRLAATRKLDGNVSVGGLGTFTLRKTHPSWTSSLLLGAIDYYKDARTTVSAYQLVPDSEHDSLDTPRLDLEWSIKRDPAWRWLNEPWPYPVPSDSTAMTNLNALRGSPVTEATRWEEDHWEMFAGAGPDVAQEDARQVPLGVLLALDPSLKPVTDLQVGAGLWREDADADWNVWLNKGN